MVGGAGGGGDGEGMTGAGARWGKVGRWEGDGKGELEQEQQGFPEYMTPQVLQRDKL